MLSSQDIAQYHSNSPIYATHKSTSVLYEKYRHSQQCQKIDTFIRGFFSDSHCSVNRKQYVGVIFDTPNTVYLHYSLAVLPSVHVVFFYTRVSDYTRRLMIANLLYSIPKVLNSYHFAYTSSRLCLHVCLVKRIINLSITSKYLLNKLASGTFIVSFVLSPKRRRRKGLFQPFAHALNHSRIPQPPHTIDILPYSHKAIY